MVSWPPQAPGGVAPSRGPGPASHLISRHEADPVGHPGLQSALHVARQIKPPRIDWLTGKRLTYDVEHGNDLISWRRTGPSAASSTRSRYPRLRRTGDEPGLHSHRMPFHSVLVPVTSLQPGDTKLIPRAAKARRPSPDWGTWHCKSARGIPDMCLRARAAQRTAGPQQLLEVLVIGGVRGGESTDGRRGSSPLRP